jgi:hypothetical protein
MVRFAASGSFRKIEFANITSIIGILSATIIEKIKAIRKNPKNNEMVFPLSCNKMENNMTTETNASQWRRLKANTLPMYKRVDPSGICPRPNIILAAIIGMRKNREANKIEPIDNTINLAKNTFLLLYPLISSVFITPKW